MVSSDRISRAAHSAQVEERFSCAVRGGVVSWVFKTEHHSDLLVIPRLTRAIEATQVNPGGIQPRRMHDPPANQARHQGARPSHEASQSPLSKVLPQSNVFGVTARSALGDQVGRQRARSTRESENVAERAAVCASHAPPANVLHFLMVQHPSRDRPISASSVMLASRAHICESPREVIGHIDERKPWWPL